LIIRETHHRIKNNIAVIGSFLSLQAGEEHDPRVVAILEEAIGRVCAIRDLYEHMLLEREFEEIDAGRYLGTIAESVIALADGETAITLECSLDPLLLQPRMMMPLGIIVNELLTNAVKYAFAGRSGGWVAVRLYREEEKIVLEVEDDGHGIESGDGTAKGGGFGLTLVSILCNQIKADLYIGSRQAPAIGGTLFRIVMSHTP
jgi:two-component sensor histidine kinase